MNDVYNLIESIFTWIVEYGILLIELIGVGVLIFTIIKSLIGMIRKDKRVRINLAEGIALAVEFKMGGELLRTVIVRDWEELLILGAVILLRAALAFLIQWEIRMYKKHEMPLGERWHDVKHREQEKREE